MSKFEICVIIRGRTSLFMSSIQPECGNMMSGNMMSGQKPKEKHIPKTKSGKNKETIKDIAKNYRQ